MPPSVMQALREIRQQRNPSEMIQAIGAYEGQLADQSDPTRPKTSSVDYGGEARQAGSSVLGPQALEKSGSRTIGAGRHRSPEEDPVCPHPGALTESAGCLKVGLCSIVGPGPATFGLETIPSGLGSSRD
jgi:hypothetical protein